MLISQQVETLMENMTLEQKVGQVLTLCFNGTVIYPLVYKQIQNFHCGGLRLTQSAIAPSRNGFRRPAPYSLPAEYSALLNQLQGLALERPLSIPLHFVMDQEGDRSSNYCMGGVKFMPSQVGLTAYGSPEAAYNAARAMARQLHSLGVHWVNSPVLDVNSNWDNPEIGWRAFSDCAEVCSSYGHEFLRGLRAENVIGSAKHFPGRGDSDEDAHHAVISLDISRETMLEREVLPYQENWDLIPSIMVAHTAFPALDDSGLPATLSYPIITDFLRGELGFDGVVTTDNMEMEGIKRLYPVPEASWRALAAGCDVVLMKAENGLCADTFNAILDAVKCGDLPQERLEEANRRLLTMKYRYGIFEQPLADSEKAAGVVREKAIEETARTLSGGGVQYARSNDDLLPLQRDCRLLLVEQFCDNVTGMQSDDIHVHNGMMLEKLLPYTRQIDHVPIAWQADENDVERLCPYLRGAYDAVIITDWAARNLATNAHIIKLVKDHNLPVISLASSPYPPWIENAADAVLLTFQTRNEGLEAAADVMFGQMQPNGKKPVNYHAGNRLNH